MSCADNTSVDVDRLPTANAFDDPFLEEAQQLYLEGQGNVADLVEEQRPPCASSILPAFDLTPPR